jgi:hypothetical protein
MVLRYLLTILLATISTGALACTCIFDDSIVNAYKSANIVFEGKVVKIDTVFISDTANIISSTYNPHPHVEVTLRKYLAVKFNIRKLFKGHIQNQIVTVMTDAVGTRCGIQFIPNIMYMVYGYAEQFSFIVDKNLNTNKNVSTETIKKTKYSTSSCTRTTTAIKSEIADLRSCKLIK